MHDLGRLLIALGVVAVAAGVALAFADRLPWLGRLPGDIVVRRGPVTVYLPLGTCLVVSVVLSILVAVLRR